MIKILKKSVFISLVLIALVGCQSLKEGFEGNRKSKNAEEFLINKKNPLVLPPDFSKLPVPKNEKDKTDSLDDFDLEYTKKNLFKFKDNLTKDEINFINKELKNYIQC